jgi:TusA-related sulfurtransferase
MKDEEIIEILSDQNFWYKDIEVGIKRRHTEKIMEKLKAGEIVVVSEEDAVNLLLFCKLQKD